MSNYKVVYNLLPQDTLPFEFDFVRLVTAGDKETIGYSADDAGALVAWGNERSKVIVWEPERIGTGITQEWFDENYPGATMEPKSFASEFRFLAHPTMWDVITQGFGENPENYEEYGLPGHEGIDFRAYHESPIMAVSPGIVSDVMPVVTGHNYGIYVRVMHVGCYETTYAHFDRVLVTEGDIVTAGQILGLADNTGNSYGDHLHLTLKYHCGDTIYPYHIVDPTPFLYKG